MPLQKQKCLESDGRAVFYKRAGRALRSRMSNARIAPTNHLEETSFESFRGNAARFIRSCLTVVWVKGIAQKPCSEMQCMKAICARTGAEPVSVPVTPPVASYSVQYAVRPRRNAPGVSPIAGTLGTGPYSRCHGWQDSPRLVQDSGAPRSLSVYPRTWYSTRFDLARTHLSSPEL